MIKKASIKKLFLIMAIGISSSSYAAIQLSNTRVIINEAKNFGAIKAKNITTEPFVVQSWIEAGDGEMNTPLFVTPPLNRMDGGEELNLTIRKIEGQLPEDRESYYWLNVLEIPKADESANNTLSLAIKTRIKVFYRPTSIGRPSDVAQALAWQMVRQGNKCQLSVKNDSAFIVNFADMKINNKEIEPLKGFMSMPFSEQVTDLPSCESGDLEARIVNDYGAFITLPVIKIN